MDLTQLPVRDGFRLRGEAVSRLETLVDAAIAFALSMVVISVGALPKDIDELFVALHRVPTFAACFLLIVTYWTGHNRWSRRFGLDDARTTNLTFVFVFVVLVYVYPLRMVLSGGLGFMTGGWVPSEMKGRLEAGGGLQDAFIVYGIGFTALSLVLLRLNQLALRQAAALELDALERHMTKREIGSYALLAATGVVSIVLAFALRNLDVHPLLYTAPGFLYSTLGITQPIYHARMGREQRELLASGTIVRNGRVIGPDDIG